MNEIIIGDVPFWVVMYYFTMWFFNAFGYWLAAFSMSKLSEIFEHSRIHVGMRRTTFLLGIYAVIRTASGLDAMIRFFAGTRSTTMTVEFLGVVSLFLNTTFICIFATVLFLEARRLKRLDEERMELLKQATQAFDTLRTATEVHKSLDTSNV